MKTQFKTIRKGFTLIELSFAIMLSMAISAMTLALFNQQLAFLKIFKAQSFLTEEAPIISMHVSKLVGKAERFSLHDTLALAQAKTAPAGVEPTRALALYYHQPNGGPQLRSILVFDQATKRLNFYSNVVGAAAPPAPDWYVSRKATDVRFLIQDGLLRMQLTGPAGEVITYSGSMQQ